MLIFCIFPLFMLVNNKEWFYSCVFLSWQKINSEFSTMTPHLLESIPHTTLTFLCSKISTKPSALKMIKSHCSLCNRFEREKDGKWSEWYVFSLFVNILKTVQCRANIHLDKIILYLKVLQKLCKCRIFSVLNNSIMDRKINRRHRRKTFCSYC